MPGRPQRLHLDGPELRLRSSGSTRSSRRSLRCAGGSGSSTVILTTSDGNPQAKTPNDTEKLPVDRAKFARWKASSAMRPDAWHRWRCRTDSVRDRNLLETPCGVRPIADDETQRLLQERPALH